jgi:hemolysin III
MEKKFKVYDEKEERFNVYSHALGVLFSVVAFVFLLKRALLMGDALHIAGAVVYGTSLVVLYSASTLYHAAREENKRKKLKIFDHASIYGLIAGTYTPYLLITLHGTWGWSLLAVIWGVALGGIIFKLFYSGRFRLASTILYVLMGMIIIVAVKPLKASLPEEGLTLLWLGGVFYIVGAVFYMIDKMKYNHAVFHLWVLMGSMAHFFSVYFYVMPQTVSN